jgi:ZIP family zinc transporter
MQPYLPYFFGVLTLFAIYFGGFIAYRLKQHTKLLIAFSGGTLVTAAIVDLIPEAIELTAQDSVTSLMTVVIASFLLFLILDKFFFTHGHSHQDDAHEHDHKSESSSGIMYSSGILFHTMLDGFIIGTGFLLGGRAGLLLAIIVLLHDFIDGISTVTVMLRHKQSKKSIFTVLSITGVLLLIGIAISQNISINEGYLAYVLAFVAGLFLYMGAADLLPEAHKDRSSWQLLLATIIGILTVLLFGTVIA